MIVVISDSISRVKTVSKEQMRDNLNTLEIIPVFNIEINVLLFSFGGGY